MDELATCEICDSRDRVELCSSGLGPVSYSRCFECQSRGAEVIGVACYWLFTYGGPKNAPDHFDKMVSYDIGEYIGRDVITDLYPKFEEMFRKERDEHFELIEDDKA